MRVIFIGCVEFSFFTLNQLLSLKLNGSEVVGVITKKKSMINSDHCSLAPLADAAGIPTLYADENDKNDICKWIKDKKPDVIFCFGWSHLLTKDILEIPPLGVVGYHPAELPKNRGRHPIIWALVLGLKQTASTFFIMDEGADTGPILSQVCVKINDGDDASSLYKKLGSVAKKQIAEFMPMLINGKYETRSQDHLKANYWRKRNKEDGKIDWRMSASSINNLVRALTKPYPGAHCNYMNSEVKIWKTELIQSVPINYEPGKVLECDNGKPIIKCGSGAIRIISHEFITLPEKGEYI